MVDLLDLVVQGPHHQGTLTRQVERPDLDPLVLVLVELLEAEERDPALLELVAITARRRESRQTVYLLR